MPRAAGPTPLGLYQPRAPRAGDHALLPGPETHGLRGDLALPGRGEHTTVVAWEFQPTRGVYGSICSSPTLQHPGESSRTRTHSSRRGGEQAVRCTRGRLLAASARLVVEHWRAATKRARSSTAEACGGWWRSEPEGWLCWRRRCGRRDGCLVNTARRERHAQLLQKRLPFGGVRGCAEVVVQVLHADHQL